ncbi:hypothetical protein PGB90_005085 [Kerria lacca]
MRQELWKSLVFAKANRFPMALLGPTNQQKILIFEEINETNPNKLEQNKAIIQQWMVLQPHLPKNYGKIS